MSEGWEGLEPAPIETFHGEAMKEFHEGTEFKSNEILIKDELLDGIRFINGIEFNRLLARFKVKVMQYYDISSDAIPKSKTTKLVELNEQCGKCFKLDLVCVGHSIKYEGNLDCFDDGPIEP